jgi:hypothetical protein
MSLMAKISISVTAVAVGGVTALGITSAVNSDSGGTGVVYYAIRSKYLPQGFKAAPNTACELRIPGTIGESVSVSVCTVELEHTSDMDSTYRLIEGSLNGGQILHWGCKEVPAPSLECHIGVDDQPKTVCISTSLDDIAVRAACEKDAGPKAPDAPPVVAH